MRQIFHEKKIHAKLLNVEIHKKSLSELFNHLDLKIICVLSLI